MAIYDLGTASLAATGEVTGVGTTWKAPLTLIRVGATIIFKTNPLKIYTISEIISDTQINVYNPNSETVPAGTGYAILAHDGITVQGLAQDVAETLRYYQSKETSIEGLLQFIGQDTFDWPRFEKLANQSTTGAAEALASQVAAAESASTAVGASNNAQNSYKRTVAAINAAGNTAAVAYFAEHGIGSTTTPLLGSLDWQTMQFYSGGSYQCRIDNMVNIPADLSSMFPATNTTICIDVLATRGINGSNVVRVSPSTASNAVFRVAEITFTGATGSRSFYVRELLSVPGGDAAAGGSSAIRVRGLLDVYSKNETFQKSLNLSDVANKSLARTNLDVYSKQDVDAAINKINGYFSSGDFTQGKKLTSNYQSFNYNGNQYSYDGQITEGSVLPSSPELDEKWKLRPISSKIESYGGGVHVADNKDAIIKAIYAGVKVLEFPAGVIRTSEIELNQVASGVKFLGKGGNQAYLGSTIIKPATPNQRSIFTSNKGLSGVDAVKFEGISFDGEWSCQHAILHESGGGWEYRDLSGNRFNTWFIYSGQGLSRFERIYCNATDISDPAKFASGGGIRVYSDSVIDTVEIYGGSVPLRLSAGGNRVNNLFCNGGMDVGAIAIEPQDDETNHINTAMSNIYIGETTNTSNSSVPILLISGNDTRRVSGVQISNAHFVHSMTTIESNMVCIKAVNADRIVCSSFDALGKGSYSTPTSRTDVFLDAYNCNSIAFSSGVINGINGHAFRLRNSSGSVDCCTIDEWGVNPRTDELSAIRLIGSSTRFLIGSSVRFNSSLSSTYAIMTENEYLFDAPFLSLSYSSPNIILPENKNYSYSYKRPGGKITFVNSYV
ncbi:hypothetical protein FP_0046 [Escherichia phage vB_EcoS_FP]|uniref:Tail fiber protein n=1 Tax=Escherichia phage vB_EcoS_FP TaxID=2750857 RepID=A0A7D5G026_9CAUD|nr:hypothetical protein FP_0046 [Escherichia phage vB_EcoS_FP]